MSGEKDAKSTRCQRKASGKTSVSRTSNDVRAALAGEKSVSGLGLQSCQQEGLSRFRGDKWRHQKRMLRARNLKEKEFKR